MQRIVREMRGIPFFLLREYLEEMGGTAVRKDYITGPGWNVKMTRMVPYRIGSLAVGQTRLEIEIEDHVLDEFMEEFGKKTLRAGA